MVSYAVAEDANFAKIGAEFGTEDGYGFCLIKMRQDCVQMVPCTLISVPRALGYVGESLPPRTTRKISALAAKVQALIHFFGHSIS